MTAQVLQKLPDEVLDILFDFSERLVVGDDETDTLTGDPTVTMTRHGQTESSATIPSVTGVRTSDNKGVIVTVGAGGSFAKNQNRFKLSCKCSTNSGSILQAARVLILAEIV